MLQEREHQLITDRTAFAQHFPLSADLEAKFSLQGKQAFLDAFLPVRNRVESEYYAAADLMTTPGERTRKFFSAQLNPIIGKPIANVEQFYQTFGRLMRYAWLSLSVGLYDSEIQAIPDIERRLLLAQVNNVDINWRAAVSHIDQHLSGKGTIVEVGTGRGNSAIRLALMLPLTQIISVTISPEQYEIVSAIVREMGLSNLEVRLADIFDPASTQDLIGRADAAGAIEVVLHFPTARKLEGMRRLTDLLKPSSPFSIVDSSIEKPLSAFAERYYANQSIYFGLREQYFAVFDDANLDPAVYVDYTPDMKQAFRETSVILRKYRQQLRQEFGAILGTLWPEIPGTLYIQTLKNVRYVHAVGIKR